jgi:lipoprotein-anchoring transpeptidase ErfK/SrfK
MNMLRKALFLSIPVAAGPIFAVAGASAVAQTQTVPTPAPIPARMVVVSLADRRLALVENGQLKKVYRVAVGKPSTPSPVGTFTIERRVANPTYSHAGKVVQPGPGNPVGTRWMGLSRKGYGIHGTNAPGSIGKAASHGCIRMERHDLEELFAELKEGDTVEIVGTPDAETAAFFSPVKTTDAPVMTIAATGAAVDSDAPESAQSIAAIPAEK